MIDIEAIQEKALKEYRQKKGEFYDPLTDWRSRTHDICASQTLAEPIPQPAESARAPETLSSRQLLSLQAEINHLKNKINEHLDKAAYNKRAGKYYET